MDTKYIFVTGGVVSSLGKGIISGPRGIVRGGQMPLPNQRQ